MGLKDYNVFRHRVYDKMTRREKNTKIKKTKSEMTSQRKTRKPKKNKYQIIKI